MIEIKITKEDAQVLVNLLNVAVQAKGLEAAEAALYFTKKIQEASDTIKASVEDKK